MGGGPRRFRNVVPRCRYSHLLVSVFYSPRVPAAAAADFLSVLCGPAGGAGGGVPKEEPKECPRCYSTTTAAGRFGESGGSRPAV